MLPVATPPNAIVFSYGYLKVADMVSMAVVSCVYAVNYMLNMQSWHFSPTDTLWICVCVSSLVFTLCLNTFK